jgi:hypothetical protein
MPIVNVGELNKTRSHVSAAPHNASLFWLPAGDGERSRECEVVTAYGRNNVCFRVERNRSIAFVERTLSATWL